MSELSLKRIYHTFYRADWVWHLFILLAVCGVLAIYTLLPASIDQLTNLVVEGKPFDQIARQAGLVFAALAGLAGFALIQEALLSYGMVTRTLNRVQSTLFDHLLHCPLTYFETHSPGDLRNVIMNIASTSAQGVVNLIKPLLAFVQGIYLLWVMAAVSLPLTLLALGVLILYTLFVYSFQHRVTTHLDQRNAAERTMSSSVDDIYRGFLEIKRNGLEEPLLDLFDKNRAAYFESTLRFFQIINTLGFAGNFVGNLLPVVLLVATALPALGGEVSPATFVTIYTLSIFLTNLVKSLHAIGRSTLSSWASWRHVFDILDAPTEPEGGQQPSHHQITWTDIGKHWRDKTILDKVSLKIEAGEKVMIVGQSGEGKSTILKMLPGLLKPDVGLIKIGNMESSQADLRHLRAQVGFATQTAYLFETSLRDNLAYGLDIDEDDIIKIIRLVQLEAFLANLPQGLDTHLGPDGYAISGGEKARIALARAILRQPPILILDEATANLDSETEEQIYAYLLDTDCTVIGVTHRLSTLMIFPRTIALADGRVAFDGPTAQLITTPLFQKLFAFQINRQESL